MSIIHLEERIAELVRICDKQTKENDTLKALVVRKDDVLANLVALIRDSYTGVTGIQRLTDYNCSHEDTEKAEQALALTPADLAGCVCVKREEWELVSYGLTAWTKIRPQFIGAVGKDAADHVVDSIADLRAQVATLTESLRVAKEELVENNRQLHKQQRTAIDRETDADSSRAAFEAQNINLRATNAGLTAVLEEFKAFCRFATLEAQTFSKERSERIFHAGYLLYRRYDLDGARGRNALARGQAEGLK